MARLGDVCESKIDTLKSMDEGYIDYIDISSVDNQKKTIETVQSMLVQDAPSRAKQLVKQGDILLSTVRPNLNAVAMVTKKYDNTLIASTGYCVLRCLESVNKKYVFYFCQSSNFIDKIVSQATGASYPAVNTTIIKNCEIPLPPIDEQRKIAAVLDKVSDLITKRCQQLDKLDLLAKSKFVEMFGDLALNTKEYPIKKLSDISEYWNGLTYKPTDTVGDGEGTLVLRSGNIQNGELAFEDNVYVNCNIKEKLFVKDNDILMCSRNGSAALVGKTAVIKGLKEPTTFGAFMMIIRSKYYRYLKTYFEMPFFRSQISTGTSTINQITGRMLNEVELPIPDMDTVHQFEHIVEQADKSKSIIQQSLKRLEILKKALMQEYFG